MRNGWSGVGIVNGTIEIADEFVTAFVGLDATLELSGSESLRRICPVMVRLEGEGAKWRYDVIEFITASNDTLGAELVRESLAGRVIFIGRPGPKTRKALEWFGSGRRIANVVPKPTPDRPVRVVWRGLDGVLLESAPDWNPQPLPGVSKVVSRPAETEESPVPISQEVRPEDQDPVEDRDPKALVNVLAPILEE